MAAAIFLLYQVTKGSNVETVRQIFVLTEYYWQLVKFPTTYFVKFFFITYCSLTEWTYKSETVIFRCDPLRCSAIAVKRNHLFMMTYLWSTFK